MSQSRIRQNFAGESEALLNKQINIELHAGYVYLSMAAYCHRDDVALKGFYEFFRKMSEEEKEHAEKIIKYVNKRGGSVVYQNIEKPTQENWGSGLEAMEAALQLEKSVNQSLLDLHKLASSHEDSHLTNWLEGEMLDEQVDSIYKISCHITNIKRIGPGLGEYMFDKKSLDS